jgi:hypothetical protein
MVRVKPEKVIRGGNQERGKESEGRGSVLSQREKWGDVMKGLAFLLSVLLFQAVVGCSKEEWEGRVTYLSDGLVTEDIGVYASRRDCLRACRARLSRIDVVWKEKCDCHKKTVEE